MDFGGPAFVIAIIAVSYGAWILNNWIRAKHGYDLEDEWGGKSSRRDSAETERLRSENRELNDKIDAMQDRMIVLEKIVTDRGYSLADEIEALRHQPSPKTAREDRGVPINFASKEKHQ